MELQAGDGMTDGDHIERSFSAREIADSDVAVGKDNKITETTDTGGGTAIRGNVDTGNGAFTGRDAVQVNVYQPTQPPKRSRRREREIMPTVEQQLRNKLNEHDIKLEKLLVLQQVDQRTFTDYINSLREDVNEIKSDLKPLIGLGVLANNRPQSEINAQQAAFVRLVLAVIAVALIGILVSIIILLTFQAFS